MKYWKQMTIFTLLTFFAQGQSITYKVIKDTPDDIANYWVNVGLLDMGFAKDNPGYGLGAVSLNSVVHYKNKFGGELTLRKYYFSLSDIDEQKGGTQFEVGAFYNLGHKDKSRSQKVILATKKSGNSTTTTSMQVPATIRRNFGVRAGFNFMKEGLVADSTEHGLSGNYISKSMGLYAGVLITSSVNMKSHTQEYGIKGAGFVRRTYIDFLFNPIHPLSNLDGTKYTGESKLGAIGYRFGIEFMKPEPRKVMGSAQYFKFEIGSRPIDGYYGMFSWGFNFKRKVKSMSSFTVIREKE